MEWFPAIISKAVDCAAVDASDLKLNGLFVVCMCTAFFEACYCI